jgi:hypothetical protein
MTAKQSGPVVAQRLNYKGDRRAAIGQVMGPNTMREYLTVVEAEYDPVADRTRLGLAYGIHRIEADQ